MCGSEHVTVFCGACSMFHVKNTCSGTRLEHVETKKERLKPLNLQAPSMLIFHEHFHS
jgi:hypothetical protein